MRKRIYRIHHWCGLVAGMFILIMGLTGSVLVFHREIQFLENREVSGVKNNLPVDIDKAYDILFGEFPRSEIRLTRFSNNPSETLLFSVRTEGKHLHVFSHPSNGSIIKVKDSSKSFLNTVLNIHYSFMAGTYGKILVLIVGLTFLMSLITGFVVYRKRLLKVLRFQIPIERKSGRYISALHYYVGVWALLLNFALVITGVLIAFDNIGSHASDSQPNPPRVSTSINRALALIDRSYPQFTPTYIWFPKSKGEPIRINGVVKDEPFYWTQYYNQVDADAETGKLSSLKLTSEEKTSKKIASVVGVIHLAEFDSMPAKILFCLAGLSAPVLSLTGFIMWRRRLRKRRI